MYMDLKIKLDKIILILLPVVFIVSCSPQEKSGRGVYELNASPSVPLVTPIWSPDAKQVTASYVDYSNHESTIYSFNLRTQEHTAILAIDGEAVAQSWSSDGIHLAMAVSGSIYFPKDGIWVFNVSDNSNSYVGPGEAAVWSSDGNLLAIYSCGYSNSGTGTVRIINLSQKEEQIVFSHRNCLKLAYMTWSSDTENIALSFEEGKVTQKHTDQIFIIDLSANKAHRILDKGSWSPSFSPDGQEIVFVKNYDLEITDKVGSCQIIVKDLGLATIGDVSWSPDGKRWAVSGLGKIYIIDIEEALGQKFFQNPALCP